MIDNIKTAFPKLVENKCFSIQNTDFGIRDDQDKQQAPSYIVFEMEEAHFKVKNPSNKEVHFLAIDKCLWNDSDKVGGRCDFIVFDEASFLFVDIKKAKMRHASDYRKDAEKQLEATLQKFQAQINFDTHKIYAIIAFVKSKISPQLATRNQNLKVKWDTKYGIDLMECNTWEFQ